LPPTNTWGTPGAHGPAGTGVQGIGVNAPIAAAVAAATIGLAILWHIPKGAIFTKGILSEIVARGIADIVFAVGRTFNTEGVIPNEQVIDAPPVTHNPIILTP
jgi:hypothetical protein